MTFFWSGQLAELLLGACWLTLLRMCPDLNLIIKHQDCRPAPRRLKSRGFASHKWVFTERYTQCNLQLWWMIQGNKISDRPPPLNTLSHGSCDLLHDLTWCNNGSMKTHTHTHYNLWKPRNLCRLQICRRWADNRTLGIITTISSVHK